MIALNDFDLKGNFLPFPQRRESKARSHVNDFEHQKIIHFPRKFKKLLAQANTGYLSMINYDTLLAVPLVKVNWRRSCDN